MEIPGDPPLHPIAIDLDEFKLHVALRKKIQLTLHFNSPSRQFYLSVIALVVSEMKRLGKVAHVPLEKHHVLLALLNDTVGGSAGSSEKRALLPRIYVKWKHALPNLEEAPLFTILGRQRGYEEGNRKSYPVTEAERDSWANLFEYQGSHENARLKFAVDKIGVSLDDTVILYGGVQNSDAWERFVSSLQKDEHAGTQRTAVADSSSLEAATPDETPRKAQRKAVYPEEDIAARAHGGSENGLAGQAGPAGQTGAAEERRGQREAAERPANRDGASADRLGRAKRVFLYGGGIIGVASLAVVLLWPMIFPPPQSPLRPVPTESPPTSLEEKAEPDAMAFPLPEQPSIAVLPFVNMSEDPDQEYFSDGITESIITALTKVPKLFVIAHTSTFAYKKRPSKIKRISEELGVRYVLQGSVQRSSDQLRITVQLIDALTGSYVWAERYDRDPKDIFHLQDEITLEVLNATRVKLTDGEQPPGIEQWWQGENGLDCYMKYLEALKFRRMGSMEDLRAAEENAKEIKEMCPEAAEASFTLSAILHYYRYWRESGKSAEECIEKGMEMARKALAINDTNSTAHSFLGGFHVLRREHDEALAQGERAVALLPGGATERALYAATLRYAGRYEEAVAMYKQTIRLSPSAGAGAFNGLSLTLWRLGRNEEAVSAARKAIQLAPKNFYYRVNLAALHSIMGKEDEARSEAAEALRLNPKFSLDSWLKLQPYKDPSALDKYSEALRKIGLE